MSPEFWESLNFGIWFGVKCLSPLWVASLILDSVRRS